MVNASSSSSSDFLPPAFVEKRAKPRIRCSYPAQVSGYNGAMKYEARAVLSNMSASGMHLRLKRRLQVGEAIFILVRLSTSPLKQESAPRITASGVVVRVEPKSDSSYGVAVQLDRHRFP